MRIFQRCPIDRYRMGIAVFSRGARPLLTYMPLYNWCIWAPPAPGPDAVVGNTERIEVAWCTKPGTGSRLIPDGAITGVHFVQTPDFVQVTGVGNLTFLNVPAGDEGGELDPHGADGNGAPFSLFSPKSLNSLVLLLPSAYFIASRHHSYLLTSERNAPQIYLKKTPHAPNRNTGNPIGGLVFSSAFGQLEEIFEWTNFLSDQQFCFRACKPAPRAPEWCQGKTADGVAVRSIYTTRWDARGICLRAMTRGCLSSVRRIVGSYLPSLGSLARVPMTQHTARPPHGPMGVYGASTFHQGEPVTPLAHPVPPSSSCTPLSTIANGIVAIPTSTPPSATLTSGSILASTSNSKSSTGSRPTATNDAASAAARGHVALLALAALALALMLVL
ncbi:hypothetical protein DXG01_013252 [Tephrocybe rancida]|nr:hypothetical protein DXG01_013252 [Tephrocybe rancida]